MTMKVTLTQAQMIQAAAAKFTGIDLPVQTSYLLARTVLEITTELQAFQGERTKLAVKYCELDEQGNPKSKPSVDNPGTHELVFKDDKARDAFIKAVSELGEEPIELKLRKPLALSAFQNPNSEEKTVLPWDLLAGLMPILEEIEG
jgi:hypothetical protein